MNGDGNVDYDSGVGLEVGRTTADSNDGGYDGHQDATQQQGGPEHGPPAASARPRPRHGGRRGPTALAARRQGISARYAGGAD